MPCFSYTVHLTLYTLHREQKIFFMFFSLSPEGHISMFIYHLPTPACVPYLYTREAYTPSGYTLRLRLYTRSKAYTEANANSGHTASPMGSGKGISSSPSFSLTRRGPDGA